MQEKAQGDAHDIEFEGSRVSVKDSLVGAVEGSKGPWMDDNNDLNPCWPSLLAGMSYYYVFFSSLTLFASSFLVYFTKELIVADEPVSSKGYVTFSLTNGPEYHISQVCP